MECDFLLVSGGSERAVKEDLRVKSSRLNPSDHPLDHTDIIIDKLCKSRCSKN